MFFKKKNKIKPADYSFIHQSILYCLDHPSWGDPPWVPDSKAELLSIEERLGQDLPKSFKEYALMFGTGNHELFGTETSLETLQEQIEPWEVEDVEAFNEFLNRFYDQHPKHKDFPIFEFSNHHGYVSYCFVLDGSPDPECFVIMDLEDIEPVGLFSDYLLNQLKTTRSA